MRGQVRFRDVSFHYPTAAVPSHLAHAAVNDRDEQTADPEQWSRPSRRGAPIGGRGGGRGRRSARRAARAWPAA